MRHRNHGLRKKCGCRRNSWPKCPHSYHLNFKQRGGKHWRLSLDVELGRHVDSTTEAQNEITRIKSEILAGTFVPARERRPAASTPACEEGAYTFELYVSRDWTPSATLNLKASTLRFYTDHLENHIIPLIGSRPIATITRKDCRQLVTTSREKGLKILTVRGIVRTLSTVLSQAVEDEHLPAHPALGMRKYLRRGDEAEPTIDCFTREEAASLIKVVREHFPEWHAWLLCGLRTGMRAGELLALQWGDVDWRGRYLFVQRNWVRSTLTTPKNHQCRQVDLSSELRGVSSLATSENR
jgi:hypothetical protein